MRAGSFEVRTGDREAIRDITAECRRFAAEAAEGAPAGAAEGAPAGAAEGALAGAAGGDGLLNVFVPHATAGVALLELGSGSEADLLAVLANLLPAGGRWRHAHGSPGHGRSHVLPAFVPPSLTIPVHGGELQLGTWQSVALVDLNVDNLTRTVRLSFLPG